MKKKIMIEGPNTSILKYKDQNYISNKIKEP